MRAPVDLSVYVQFGFWFVCCCSLLWLYLYSLCVHHHSIQCVRCSMVDDQLCLLICVSFYSLFVAHFVETNKQNMRKLVYCCNPHDLIYKYSIHTNSHFQKKKKKKAEQNRNINDDKHLNIQTFETRWKFPNQTILRWLFLLSHGPWASSIFLLRINWPIIINHIQINSKHFILKKQTRHTKTSVRCHCWFLLFIWYFIKYHRSIFAI